MEPAYVRRLYVHFSNQSRQPFSPHPKTSGISHKYSQFVLSLTKWLNLVQLRISGLRRLARVGQATLPRADLMAQAMPRMLRHLVPMQMTNGQKFSVRTPVLIADVVDLEEVVAMPELEVLAAVVATEDSVVIAETLEVTVEVTEVLVVTVVVTEASVVIVEVTEALVVKAEASVGTVVETGALVAVIAAETEVMAEIVVDSEVDLAVMRSLSTILALLANLATLEVEAGVIEVSAVTEEVTVRAEEASAVTEVVTVVETEVLVVTVGVTEASVVIVAAIEEDMAVVTEAVIVGATAEVAVAAAKAMALLPTLPTPRCLPALALPWRTRST